MTTSTINPLLPVYGSALTSAPVRDNFQAAYNDINAIFTLLDSASYGTMAFQNANNVAITGGSITGITPLAVADGGTGGATASAARTNLGLGALAVKNSVDLASADVSGNLAVTHLAGGVGASNTTFWRGDGSWGVPSGSGLGDVVGPGSATANGIVLFDGTSGTVIKDSTYTIGNSLLNALLPSQAAKAGYILGTNATNSLWQNYIDDFAHISNSGTDTATTFSTFSDVAENSVYSSLSIEPSGNSTAVKAAIFGEVIYDSTSNVTGTGHNIGILGRVDNINATGTVALAIGVEGRLDATLGSTTIGACFTAAIADNSEGAGLFGFGVGLYIPNVVDSAHISQKYAIFNAWADGQIYTAGKYVGTTLELNASSSQIVLDADAANKGTITMAALSGSRTYTLPNASGTFYVSGSAIAVSDGGTGSAFTAFTGPTTSQKTFTLPNASSTILTTNAAVTVAQGGSGATTLTGVLKGNGTSAFSAATAGTDFVAPGTVTLFTAQQNFGTATLTDAATINWNLTTGQVAKVTLAGNRTMAAPTNMVDGGTYILRVIQSGGSNTITWNSVFKWPGGTPPTLSTSASAIDVIAFVSDGTNMYGTAQIGFA